MARYFVTGGSGFLGANVCRYLTLKGHEVTSFHTSAREYPGREKVTDIVGDIRDREALAAAMKGADIVIHCAAVIALDSAEDIKTTDIEGTRNVLECAQRNGVKRVIHISSTAVYGIPKHAPVFETDTLHGVDEYGKAKIQSEAICEEYRKKGLVVSVLRPKSIVGPGRLGIFAMFYEWAATGHNFPIIGNGKNRYQHLDAEDMCDAIYLCATKDATVVNDTFNIAAKDFSTMKEEYQAVMDKAGFGKRILCIPATPVVAGLRLLDMFNLSPFDASVFESASRDSFVSIEKAERILGYSPRYSNTELLVRNFDLYRAHPSSSTSSVRSLKSLVFSVIKWFF